MPRPRKTGTQEELGRRGPGTPRAAPRTPPPPKPPSAENVGSRRSRFWRHLPLPSSLESPPRRRGRLCPTSSPPPYPFLSFPPAARPLLPPPSFPHPVCVPLPLRLSGRLGRPRPDREAGAPAAAATRGCGGSEIRGPEAALHLVRARGGCLCTPSRGPRGLASSRGGGGKGESRARCGTAPGEKAGRTPAAASSPCFSLTALWRPGRLPDRGGLEQARGKEGVNIRT